MKITYLITGSGGSFYCGNCYRDMIYLRAIRKVPGTEASAIPLYLPPDASIRDNGIDNNVFFGAISLYIREKVPFLRNMPSFFDKILDSPPMLKLAARQAGTTRTEGMEDMTLNMISGEKAFPEKELERLADHLIKEGTPDIIHLSNSLVVGLAKHLKRKIPVRIVCSVLNEDDWINDMAEPFQTQAWKLMAEEDRHVDAFITPSTYYRDFFISKTGISREKVHVVPLGFEPGPLVNVMKKAKWPSIGYFCRVNSHNGFDKLVDAFILLSKRGTLPGLTLHVSGGYTGDDKPFVSLQLKKIRKAGLEKSVRLYPEFLYHGKIEFFENIDLMSVPVRKYDGYGLYILEANSAGVPVLQPHTGAFPEIIENTGGGIIYGKDDIEGLADAAEKLLKDRKKLDELGVAGRKNVLEKLSLEKMAEDLGGVYKSVFQTTVNA